MATLKEVKIKIEAVKKTRQITRAMNMVAASKLRGAQAAMEGFRPYALIEYLKYIKKLREHGL